MGYSYDALGNVVQQSAFGNPTSAVAYQYTGQEFDSETQLHNFRARLYDSDLFRFYATDPAGQDFSPYAFAGNAPVIRVDKDGKLWFIPVVLALGAAMNVASNWGSITQNGFDVGRLFGYGRLASARQHWAW